ncbi:MAG TPA: TonB-dependent receptor [Mucilaginibacter sp.]|nr:TonB-dependent receptor [Mucilaginibacter sp.]
MKGQLQIDARINYASVVVQLLKNDKKTISKMEFADTSGNFSFDKVAAGEYYVSVSDLNIQPWLSDKIQFNADVNLGTIKLTPKSNNLNEVSVSAAKPLIQQFYDKTVVNVANNIKAAGSTALDVLVKSPGITIDKDDNIAMRGRQGVLIMIDGKLVPMSGTDLATMLRNMSANQIDRIELITNPSAKYDAQGNSGIIDIRLKKDSRKGTNGSVTGSYGQGKYGKFTSGISLNNRTANLNLFGSYNYGDRTTFNQLDIMRSFYDANDVVLGGYDEHNYLKTDFISHNVRLGADYYLTPKTIIGIVANGLYFNNYTYINNNAFSLNNQLQDTSSFTTGAHNSTARSNNSVNINFKTIIDSTGRELTADLDYASFDRTDLQHYLTQYFNLENVQDQPPYVLFGDLTGNLSIRSVKSDYTQPLSKKAKLDFGIKSSWVHADNNVAYYDQSNGGDVLDTTKSNHFIYDENINAAYANANANWGKTSLQIGLRVENTVAKGIQLTNDSSFNRNYTQLFPSGFFGYKLDNDNDLGISVSRRINRPTYSQLNPFKIFLDPTTYAEGNPYLKPEITDSYELNWTFKQNYLLKAGFSTTTDNIIFVLSPDALNSTVVVQEPQNIARFNYYNISLSVPFSAGKWLSSTNNLLAYYGKYNGNVANTDLTNSIVAFNLNTANTITINKLWTAEIDAYYHSRDIYGFQNSKPYGSLDMGVQTKLFGDKAVLKFNLSDILYTNYYEANTSLTGYKEHFIQHLDSRVATISLVYKFGNSQLAPSRRKLSGVEDEKRRAG